MFGVNILTKLLLRFTMILFDLSECNTIVGKIKGFPRRDFTCRQQKIACPGRFGYNWALAHGVSKVLPQQQENITHSLRVFFVEILFL